ncbi:MAG: Gfo/Idh/MocA family oxidoreductase [Defluviitaleaceae bacterium]|nr:Gfo/Idh/MocA family oxidoreductase [Defluviitaleaceae bacterium]
MAKPLKTVLVGAGGYGANYVNYLLDEAMAQRFSFAAVVDPYADKSIVYESFKDIVPIYASLPDFFKENNADLTIISTPLFLHYEQCKTAMESGSHVLCEKPLVPTMDELNRLVAIQESTRRRLSVGFQWCYSEVVIGLKERILAGELGKPVSLKALVCWPRTWQYYARGGGWAGKMRTKSGQAVYDSVISNATAHYIQNILFLLGPDMESSAKMNKYEANYSRANDIETFDTILLQGDMAGAKVFYAASHAVNYQIGPVMDYTFENARVMVNMYKDDYHMWVHHNDGRVENLGIVYGNGDKNRLIYTAECIDGTRPWVCSAKTVQPFTALIDSIFKKPDFRAFPEAKIIRDSKKEITYVRNLHLDLMERFSKA